MTGVLAYSAVITKLRAMYSRLLTFDDYEILMSKQSVAEIVLWLKKSPGYGVILKNIPEGSKHRGDIEKIFWSTLYEDAEGLSKMLGAKEKRMLEVFLSRQEIDILKNIIRSIITDEGTTIDYSSKYHKWYESKSLKELTKNLKGTEYVKLLKVFSEKEDVSIFEIERTLDELYFGRLKESANKYLSRTDAKNILDFISAEVDVYNLLNAYRYKKYYEFEGKEILVSLVPNKRKIKRADLQRIVEADIDNFIKEIKKTGYGGLFEKRSEKEWDISLQDFLCKLYKKHLRQNPYSFTTILAYFYLKEMDIRNITTIIEGVRYGLDPSVIKTYLVKIK